MISAGSRGADPASKIYAKNFFILPLTFILVLIYSYTIKEKAKNNNMLINKITTGFVTQTFDTNTRKYISQNFTAGGVDYESTDGQTPIEDGFMESVNFGPYADKEPYLPFDMLQPNEIQFAGNQLGDSASCRESIQEDLLALMDGLPQDAQTRACQIVVDNFQKFFQK